MSPLFTPQRQQGVVSISSVLLTLAAVGDLSEVPGNVVFTLWVWQVGGTYSMAAMQHPSHTRGNRRMVYGVLLLTISHVMTLQFMEASFKGLLNCKFLICFVFFLYFLFFRCLSLSFKFLLFVADLYMLNVIIYCVHMVPTRTEKKWESIFQSGNFAETGKVGEFYPKYWKKQKKIYWKYSKSQENLSASNSENPANMVPCFQLNKS